MFSKQILGCVLCDNIQVEKSFLKMVNSDNNRLTLDTTVSLHAYVTPLQFSKVIEAFTWFTEGQVPK